MPRREPSDGRHGARGRPLAQRRRLGVERAPAEAARRARGAAAGLYPCRRRLVHHRHGLRAGQARRAPPVRRRRRGRAAVLGPPARPPAAVADVRRRARARVDDEPLRVVRAPRRARRARLRRRVLGLRLQRPVRRRDERVRRGAPPRARVRGTPRAGPRRGLRARAHVPPGVAGDGLGHGAPRRGRRRPRRARLRAPRGALRRAAPLLHRRRRRFFIRVRGAAQGEALRRGALRRAGSRAGVERVARVASRDEIP